VITLKKFFLFLIVFLLIPISVIAQEEEIGIPSESDEYNTYTSCVSTCDLCESRCQDTAVQEYAENNNDASICDKLSSEELKSFCTDNINSALAIASKDKSKCANIKDEDLKRSCEFVIVQQKAIETGDPNACSVLEFKQSCVSAVYRNLATKNNDASYCEKLPTIERRECLEGIIEEGGDIKEGFKLPSINFTLLFIILGGIILLAGLAAGIYFLVKRKPKQNEAPLLFRQQTQPSQLAKGMQKKQSKQQRSQQLKKLDLNKIQDALKKVGK